MINMIKKCGGHIPEECLSNRAKGLTTARCCLCLPVFAGHASAKHQGAAFIGSFCHSQQMAPYSKKLILFTSRVNYGLGVSANLN